MSGKRCFFLAMILICFGTPAARADDFGYWQLYVLRGPITQKLDWIFYPEIISDEGASSLSFMLLQEGVRYRATSWMEWGLGYAFVRVRSANGSYFTQHWEEPEITFTWKIGSIPFSWRHRVEIRQLHQATDRYRGRFGIASPTAWTPLHLVPYASYEYFYDFRRNAQLQNRAILGLRWPIDHRTELSLYYLRQGLLDQADWRHINYIGTELRFQFGNAW